MPDFTPFDSNSDSNPLSDALPECALRQQVQRLYKLKLQARWIFVGLLWLVVAPLSLWGLRHEFPLWFDYFTWTALRYSLIYNPLSAIGLITCICLTASTAIWQLRNSLFGISAQHHRQLEKQVLKICQQGKKTWLWKRVCSNES